VAAAAYRAGLALLDERTGQRHDYTRRSGVVLAEVVAPDGGSAERLALWNAAEGAEKRKDARTAREWVVALPAELDAAQRADLARSFGAELARRYGVAVDVAVHLPDREGDNRNHHVHVLMTTRQVSRDADGALRLGEKASLELSDRKRRELGLGPAAEDVTAIRELWAGLANAALERAGLAQRIDARSLAAQGIDREATTHLGPVASEMERRGRRSDRGDGNRRAKANSERRVALKTGIADLKAERKRREAERIARMSSRELAAEIERLRPPDTATLAERDPAVQKALAEQKRLMEAHGRAQEQEQAASLAATQWRRAHPLRAKLHDADVFRSAYLEEQAKVATDARQGWLEAAPRIRDAEMAARHIRRGAELRITEEMAPMRAYVAGLEQLRQQKVRQEQEAEQKRQAEQGRREVTEGFEIMAKRRSEGERGYTDNGRLWQAAPAPLRGLIDEYNRQPPQAKTAVLDGIRNNPDACKKIKNMFQQRKRALARDGPDLGR